MLESFAVVGTQVLILFVMICLGFFAGKVKIINEPGIKCINDIMLYIVNPCVIIEAFQRPFDPQMLGNLLKVIGGAFLGHLLFIGIAFCLFGKNEQKKKAVLRFAIMFSNCGFMALPLLDALLGDEGVFYGAGYVVVFNLLVWSLGQYMMAKGEEGFSTRKIIINPGVIACAIGVTMFVSSISLPQIILSPIEYLAALNTPVPMLIIGYTISKMKFGDIFTSWEVYPAVISRLVLCPIILLAILYVIGYRGNMLIALIVSSSAPVGAMTTMFSIKFNKDVNLSSKAVSLSTLFSVITMTVIVGIARFIA